MAAIKAVALALIGVEAALTEADTKVGDGDCGTTHTRGAQALADDVAYYPLDEHPAALALALGHSVRRSMGGTSGALYDIFFAAAAAAMKGAEGEAEAAPGDWLAGFIAGTEAVKQYGGAVAGNRTMLVGRIHDARHGMFCICFNLLLIGP